jgi:hypothetical protein
MIESLPIYSKTNITCVQAFGVNVSLADAIVARYPVKCIVLLYELSGSICMRNLGSFSDSVMDHLLIKVWTTGIELYFIQISTAKDCGSIIDRVSISFGGSRILLAPWK